MANKHCTCSLVQLKKGGYDTDPKTGLVTCHKCRLPTIDSVRKMVVADLVDSYALPPVLIVTMNDVPGYEILEVHGDVFGLTVRSRNALSNFGSSMRTIVGGEAAGLTRLLGDSRLEARTRLINEARKLGANAVVAMRFDCNEIGDVMNEIAAYGTAVTIRKLDGSTGDGPTNLETSELVEP